MIFRQNKRIILLVLISLLMPLIVSGTHLITNFSDGTTSGNLTLNTYQVKNFTIPTAKAYYIHNISIKYPYNISYGTAQNWTSRIGDCYQESSVTSNQTGIDGNCGLNYSGNLTYENGTCAVISNYSKPAGVTAAMLRYSIGRFDSGSTNITLPSRCFNTSIVSIKMYSNASKAGNIGSAIYCFNGTDYETLSYYIAPANCSPDPLLADANPERAYSGDWGWANAELCTDAGWFNLNDAYGYCGAYHYYINEEAIYWDFTGNFTDNTYLFNISGYTGYVLDLEAQYDDTLGNSNNMSIWDWRTGTWCKFYQRQGGFAIPSIVTQKVFDNGLCLNLTDYINDSMVKIKFSDYNFAEGADFKLRVYNSSYSQPYNLSIFVNNTKVYENNYSFSYANKTEIVLNLSNCTLPGTCIVNFTNTNPNARLEYSNIEIFLRNHSVSSYTNATKNQIKNFSVNISYNSTYIDSIACNMTLNNTVYSMVPTDNTDYYTCAVSLQLNDTGTHTFNYSYEYNGQAFTTESYSIIVYDANISYCNKSQNYNWTILNMTYFDENTLAAINLTNSMNVTFDDGYDTINKFFSFPITINKSSAICTNYNLTAFNWNMYGTITLSKTGYITRVINIDEDAPIVVSNNPFTALPLYLIGVSNSTTMTYTWLSTSLQLLDGTMRIYYCNSSGAKLMVESIPVINGIATANIELFTKSYSYDIVVGSTIYTGTFSDCHVESTTTRTFYVDTGTFNMDDLIGMSGIPIDLTKISNTSIKIEWGANPENSSFISACILIYNNSGTGNENIYEECTTQEQFAIEGYAHTYEIATYPSDIIIYGKLEQGDNYYYSTDYIEIRAPSPASEEFGLSGLLGVFLLVVAMALFFAKDGEMQLLGAGIALIGSFFLAISQFSWLTIASGLAFLMLIYVIGRHSRTKT